MRRPPAQACTPPRERCGLLLGLGRRVPSTAAPGPAAASKTVTGALAGAELSQHTLDWAPTIHFPNLQKAAPHDRVSCLGCGTAPTATEVRPHRPRQILAPPKTDTGEGFQSRVLVVAVQNLTFGECGSTDGIMEEVVLPRRTTQSVTAASKAPIPAAPARAPQPDLLPVLLGVHWGPLRRAMTQRWLPGPAVPTPSRVEAREDDRAAAALTDE